jgi:hypothetical protein
MTCASAASQGGRRERLSLQPLAAILLLSCLPFLPGLRDPLFGDDYLHIERAVDLHSGTLQEALRSWVLRAEDASAWWTPPDLAIPYFRPLVSLSFLFDHAVWGLWPFGYHLTNLALHLLSTLVCWGLATRVLGHGASAFAAAALFGIHPAHTEAVAWVSGRTDLLIGLFAGAAALCLLPDARRQPPGIGRLALGGLLALLALGAKEMAMSLPAVALLGIVLWPGEASLSRRLAGPILAGVLTAAALLLRWKVLGGFEAPPHPFAHLPGDPDFLQNLLLAPALYLADLVLFVPPDPVVTYPFWTAHPLLLSALVGVTLLVLAGSVRSVADRRTRLWSLGWIAITLLPVLTVSVGERFLYLPSMAYCVLIGAKLPRDAQGLSRRERRGLGLVGSVVLLVALLKTAVFSGLAGHSRQAIDDALAEIDRCGDCSLLLVADLPAASALAFPHAIRLERPDRRIEVEILSIAPQFLGSGTAPGSHIQWASDDRLVLRRDGEGFLGTYIEQAFLGQRPALRPQDQIERPGFSVRVLEVEGPRLRSFEVRIHRPVQEVLLFRGEGFHLKRAAPD